MPHTHLASPSDRLPEQDAVICALIGLARAAEGKEIPPQTAPVLFAALASVMPGDPLSAPASLDLIKQIHEQKAVISPDCSSCPSPCGRTADFLPEELNKTDDALFQDRNRLLKELSSHAKVQWKRLLSGEHDPLATKFFMDAVFMAGYAYETSLFEPYFEKLDALPL